MRFVHSIAVQEQAISADGIYSFDLGVNPLSMLLIAVRPLNDTGTLSNFQSYLGIVDAINRITVARRGESVVNMKAVDVAALNYFRHGIIPFQGQHDDTDNERRCAVLPVLFGKNPYDPLSCLPAMVRGELSLELDLDIADTGYDGLRISVEAIEILEAKPKEYERKLQIAQTWAATGDVSMEIQPGYKIRGFQLFGTTGFAGATPAPSWGRAKVVVDNQEYGYSATDFEVSQMIGQLWGRQPPSYDSHKHRTTTDGNAQTLVQTVGSPTDIGLGWDKYSYLEFDPSKDDAFILDGVKASRIQLVANAETADAVRAIPVEVILL